MHSRIYQISKDPIPEEQYLTEERYEGDAFGPGLMNGVVDYVSSDTDRSSDVFWLKELLGDAVAFDGDTSFTIISREAFFRPHFEEFMDAVNSLKNATLDSFSRHDWENLGSTLYRLKSAYSDEYGMYVDDGGKQFGLATLSDFFRSAKEGETYYIGATFDYHW